MLYKLSVTIYLLLAAALQVVLGNFPLHVFAFPLNIIAAIGWIFLLWRLYKEGKQWQITRFLLAPSTSILSIILLIAGSLIIGLFPQLTDQQAAQTPGIAAALGCYNFMTSWLFIAVLFLLLSNLGMVTLHAFYHRKRARKRFLLNHIGLWLALFAGFFGSSDVQTLRVPLYINQPTREAYSMDGAIHYLSDELELQSFEVEHYPNGTPSRFAAGVRIGNKEVTLEVNHPHSTLTEDVYLTGYEMKDSSTVGRCILQIVRQPWKYITVAGILMMLAGAVLLFINGPQRKKI